MVTIKNRQRTISLNKEQLAKDALTILRVLEYEDFDLGIWITNNRTIRTYNRDFRKKDKATDILSFSFHPNLKPGEKIIPKHTDDKNLGDLIISAEFVKKAAEELDVSFEERMKVLLVHGICHLLGYDHEDDADYEIMQQKEDKLLKHIK